MVADTAKKSNVFPALLAMALFILACVMQAVDDAVPIPQLRLIFTLTVQYIFFGLMAWWTVSMISRVSVKGIRNGLTITILLMGLLLFIRLIKYNIFHGESTTRYLWYSYYIPQCLAPAVLLLTLIGAEQSGEKPLAKRWYLLLVPAAALILLVFTNDFHQIVFFFPKGLGYANKVYDWGVGYYLILAWIVGLYLADGVLLYVKCRVFHCRRRAWIPLVLFLFCFTFCILREVLDPSFLRMPETVAFSVVVVCESLIRIGFIPSNSDHAQFFDVADISASIADRHLHTVLSSKNAPILTSAQLKEAAESGKITLDEDTLLCARAIRGGVVFWTQDLAVIHRINTELAETNATLAEEGDLIAAENALKEQRLRIEEQNKLYEGIFTVFRPHLQKMQAVFSRAQTDAERDEALRMALVYGVYLKRRSNLVLLVSDGEARFSELVYAVRESADALSFLGTVSSVAGEGDGVYPTEQIIFLYEFFEDCIECALPSLSACLVCLTAAAGKMTCRVTLDGAAALPPADWRAEECGKCGAVFSVEEQDGTAYLSLTLGEGEAGI